MNSLDLTRGQGDFGIQDNIFSRNPGLRNFPVYAISYILFQFFMNPGLGNGSISVIRKKYGSGKQIVCIPTAHTHMFNEPSPHTKPDAQKYCLSPGIVKNMIREYN